MRRGESGIFICLIRMGMSCRLRGRWGDPRTRKGQVMRMKRKTVLQITLPSLMNACKAARSIYTRWAKGYKSCCSS